MVFAVREGSWKKWDAAEESVPAPAFQGRRPIAKIAPQGRSVWEKDRVLAPLAVVLGDVVPRDASAIQLHLHQVEGRRLHPRTVDGHAVEQILRIRTANELGDASDIEHHGRGPTPPFWELFRLWRILHIKRSRCLALIPGNRLENQWARSRSAVYTRITTYPNGNLPKIFTRPKPTPGEVPMKTGELRMIRIVLGRAALAGAFVWLVVQAGPAQEKKEPAAPVKVEPAPTAGTSPQAQKINEYIRKGYESAGIKKSAVKATDQEYIRRVFIDLIGRIATPEEVLDFENDKSADKRAKLVQRLLGAQPYNPKKSGGQPFTVVLPGPDGKPKSQPLTKYYAEEYAEHWANIWTVWLMTRTGHADYRDQMHAWLEDQFSVTPSRASISQKDLVTKLLTATGQVGGAKMGTGWTPKPEYAANFIVHHLGEAVKDAKERSRDGAFDAVPITSRVTKLFLGLQTQCTQCHDHPFNKEWVQSDFWGVNAFFRQTVRSATPSLAATNAKMLNANSVTLTDMTDLNPEMIVYYERRDGRRLGSFPIMLKDYAQAQAGEKSTKMIVSAVAGKTRRQQLAEWVVTHDNFGRAYANRLWAHFFGRGLNKEPAADDFGSNNEIVHPELLDYLGKEFATYNYDPKKLMEWICTCDVYQLSHVGVKENLDVKFDPFFARMPMKAMSPEVLFESLMTATGTQAEKRNPAAAEARKGARDAWMRKLVRQFGDDEGNELSFNGTIVQALLMMNGSELNGEIGVGRNAGATSVVAELLKKNGATDKMYDDLFLLTLNRRPTNDEKAKLNQVREGKASVTLGRPPPKGPPSKGPNPPPKSPTAPVLGGNDAAFYQDVFWALLNTSEFMINH